MTDTEDFSISENNAQDFYDIHIKDNNSSEIISVIGSWGTGKSKVKEELLELINEEKGDRTITVAYDALQFEETSQVTSELYNVIAKSKSLSLWDFCTRNKLRAAAQLKKESTAQSISTSQIWSIFIVAFLTFLIGKLSNVSEFNSINKLITGFLIFLMIFFIRNKILSLIAGLLPRKSHIEVLESINFKQKNLIILIDEIDRLSPEATKLLFDEVLIIKDSFKKAKVKFKIIMFYDEDVVLHNYRTINIYEPHIFLQKFYDRQYRLPRAFFFDDLYAWAVNIKKKKSTVLYIPTAAITRHIADNLISFREKDKLIKFFEQQVARFISDDTKRSSPLDANIFIFSLSLRFYFDLRQLDDDTSGKLYSVYLEKGINILDSIYNSSVEDLRLLISNEINQLVKPYSNELYTQKKLINQTILNPNINEITHYCTNIIDSLEFFYWSDFSWAEKNLQEFNNYLTEKNMDFTALIFELSRQLQNTINQAHSAKLTSERENFSIKHIQDLYIKRIECVRFFLYLYIKLGNSITNLIPVRENEPLDCLIICALLKFNRKTDKNHFDTVEVDNFIHSAIPDGDKENILDLIKESVSNLKDLSHLFNDSLYMCQASDLILALCAEVRLDDIPKEQWGSQPLYPEIRKLNNSINSLIYILIFQNNPLKLELHSLFGYYKELSTYEFNREIKTLFENPLINRINSPNRDHYRNK
jgi:hypothetical protein